MDHTPYLLTAAIPAAAGILAAAAILAAYYLVLTPLALIGLQRIVLLFRSSRELPAPAGPSYSRTADLPRVLVQLPVYNERCVATRLIEAASRLEYPRERLEIQVLDDSTDDTTERIATLVMALAAQGVPIRHLRRSHRDGFKAGALAHGLCFSDAELVAVFDADFVPAPDFLRRMLPSFEDPGVGMAQARWGHLNREASLLTRVQALLLDGHFLIEQRGRAAAGLFFNFNGTAGIWRRQAIDEAGGWQHDTLTEDLDLSYRAQLRGWRFAFRPDVEVPAELPAGIHAYRSQQQRWTRGSTQTLRKLGHQLLCVPAPLHQRLQALLHLGANLCYPLVVTLAVLLFPAMVARRTLDQPGLVYLDLGILVLATASIALFYLTAAARAGIGRVRGALLLPALMALGAGMAWHNARAAIAGLWRPGGEFERTPKDARSDDLPAPIALPGYAASNPRLLAEAILGGVLALVIGVALAWRVYWALPFLCLFCSGYGYVLTLAWMQRSRAQVRAASSEELDLAA
jgi:cellulose synthase/poly-beta-1,6-N-acetylglucosamine synthase-like glycosyltransferase